MRRTSVTYVHKIDEKFYFSLWREKKTKQNKIEMAYKRTQIALSTKSWNNDSMAAIKISIVLNFDTTMFCHVLWYEFGTHISTTLYTRLFFIYLWIERSCLSLPILYALQFFVVCMYLLWFNEFISFSTWRHTDKHMHNRVQSIRFYSDW